MLRASRAAKIHQYNFGQPPLNKFFGSLPRDRKTAVDAGVKSTTLANGTRVVTHDKDQAHACVAVYVDAGPKYDPVSTPGLSYVMRFALLTSNLENSLFQVDRTMRANGFSYGHDEVRKRYVVVRAEGRRDLLGAPVKALLSAVSVPRFHEPDVERFRDTFDNLLQEQRWQRPTEYAVDQLESVAFFKEPLGSPRMVPPFANDKCSSTAMMEQYASLYLPSAVTVVGVNVAHNDLVSMYETHPYPHSADAPHHAAVARRVLSHADEDSQFHAGRHTVEYENRAKEMGTRPDMEDEVIAAVGWLSNGRDGDAKAYAAAAVYAQLFAANLRAGTQYNHHATTGSRVFYRPYSTTGLVGFTARTSPSSIASLLRDTAALLPSSSTGEDALSAAKARAGTAFFSEELEINRDYADFLGSSKASAEEVLAAIRGVTVKDIKAAADKARSTSPAIYATGKTHDFPSAQKLALKY